MWTWCPKCTATIAKSTRTSHERMSRIMLEVTTTYTITHLLPIISQFMHHCQQQLPQRSHPSRNKHPQSYTHHTPAMATRTPSLMQVIRSWKTSKQLKMRTPSLDCSVLPFSQGSLFISWIADNIWIVGKVVATSRAVPQERYLIQKRTNAISRRRWIALHPIRWRATKS